MSKRYTAHQGEAWDQIAYTLWGKEALMTALMEANPDYREVVLFGGGETLSVPDMDLTETSENLPAWKTAS